MTTLTNLTKQPAPKIAWKKIKEEILGKKYGVSIVLSGQKRLRNLNKKYRKKNKGANVLSFPYSKTEGEIYLDINQNKEKIAFLFIHSLLHLKGLKHGEKMEKLERLYYNKLHEA